MALTPPEDFKLNLLGGFRADVRELSAFVHRWAQSKGFWDYKGVPIYCEKATKIALMHSETSELLETIRKPAMSSIEGYSNEEEELADLVIRVLDYCGHYNLDLGGAILAKVKKNLARPHKHGKAF